MTRRMLSCTYPYGFMSHALFPLFLLMVLAGAAQAQAGQHTLPTRHVRPVVADGKARPVGSLPGKQSMHLDIMLPLRNQPQLTTLLHQLYDPSSPQYRHFLRVAQFTAQFGPTANDYQTVIQWAQAEGFTVGKSPANRMLVPITGTVDQVNKTFHVSMRTYQHPTENRIFFSPDREPTADVGVPLWHIAGMDNYSIPHPMVSVSKQATANITGSGPDQTSYLPSDMRAAYYGGTALTGSGQSVGLFELSGYDINDVVGTFDGTASVSSAGGNNYTLTYTPPSGGGPYNISINNVLVDGGTMTPATNSSCYNGGFNTCEGEVVLDIAQPIGMAPGISQVIVYIAPYGYADGDTEGDDIFNAMASDDSAKQLSSSWAWDPSEPTENDPIFEEFQAQGQNFFVASGDNGAWPNSNRGYYPAEDGNVISVGGTSLATYGSGGAWASETAWGGSSGGVSPDNMPIPPYQQISGFTCNGCSTTYRNVPDVAMEAANDNYGCSVGSPCVSTWGGTSLAAPRWAGFMALVNQQATINGTGPVGFINRDIYPIGLGSSYDADFHDITNGCDYSSVYCASTGYDLVTGWGSPNGQNLLNALAGIAVPQYNDFYTFGDYACGSADPDISDDPCYITITITFSVRNGESLVVNGQPVSLYNNSYTYSQTENWGTGKCSRTQDTCTGFAQFTTPVTAFATEPGYPNSPVVSVNVNTPTYY